MFFFFRTSIECCGRMICLSSSNCMGFFSQNEHPVSWENDHVCLPHTAWGFFLRMSIKCHWEMIMSVFLKPDGVFFLITSIGCYGKMSICRVVMLQVPAECEEAPARRVVGKDVQAWHRCPCRVPHERRVHAGTHSPASLSPCLVIHVCVCVCECVCARACVSE
jgi:hypothetical protein